MCRLAAYLGPEIALNTFLLEPQHSLYVQSWEPQELKYAKLNADGFGVGWYDPQGTPTTYINPMPIWSDGNLAGLARSLRSDLWLASVRSATEGFTNSAMNTQPFCDDDFLFMHNGYLGDFHSTLRPQMLRFLNDRVLGDMRGTTDSEFLFALIRHFLDEDDSLPLESAISEAFTSVSDWSDGQVALLNLLISDGERLYATRHAINHECPSLYYCTDDELFPEGAQLIASEGLTPDALWQAVPEHHLLVLDPEAPPELLAL